MLLICKSTTRQGDKLKVIRMPMVVDKLVTREYNKDPCSFGLVYLNEYGTAIAALALHGRDNKLVKQWYVFSPHRPVFFEIIKSSCCFCLLKFV
jgi:hypothetical protein